MSSFRLHYLCQVASEFEIGTLYECKEQDKTICYRFVLRSFLAGEEVNLVCFDYDLSKAPDHLIALLCEADFTKPLPYEHEKMVWLLEDEDFET